MSYTNFSPEEYRIKKKMFLIDQSNFKIKGKKFQSIIMDLLVVTVIPGHTGTTIFIKALINFAKCLKTIREL